nr:unnamed protein product [Callosobruchus analis]
MASDVCVRCLDNFIVSCKYLVFIICEKRYHYREKTLLQKLLDENEFVNKLLKSKVEDLEKKVVTLNNMLGANTSVADNERQQAIQQSYSGFLKRSAKSASPVLVVKSKDKDSNTDVMKSLIQDVNLADLKICVNGTKKIRGCAAAQ